MNLTVAYSGDSYVKEHLSAQLLLRHEDDLWCFRQAVNTACLLSIDDQSLGIAARGNLLEEAVKVFKARGEKLVLLMLGTTYFGFGILFDRQTFAGRKLYRSVKGLMLDLCLSIDEPLKYLYVDREGLPIVTSTVSFGVPIGLRMGF